MRLTTGWVTRDARFDSEARCTGLVPRGFGEACRVVGPVSRISKRRCAVEPNEGEVPALLVVSEEAFRKILGWCLNQEEPTEELCRLMSEES